MAIDFDTTKLPTGSRGWHGLVAAIHHADPADENEFIEFKANLSPTTKEGSATLAKSIVAFANRDPQTASRWFGGHALILLGVEPGNVPGTEDVDPADLHNKVNALIAQPPPRWDHNSVTYEGRRVGVITVDPPQQGDPIACIGKSSCDVVDGNVFVRRLGLSDRAKAADLRRLSARLLPAQATLGGVTVGVHPAVVPRLNVPATWTEDWLDIEESRLLGALMLTQPLAGPATVQSPAGDAIARARDVEAMFSIRHDEDRTESEYRTEVADYLNSCRDAFPAALDDLRATKAVEVDFTLTNHTDQNFEHVQVELHVEGDVLGFDDDPDFNTLDTYLPNPPRRWGPWTSNKFTGLHRAMEYGSIFSAGSRVPILGGFQREPGPTIINGGSVTIRTVPTHLRPRAKTELATVRLIAGATISHPIKVTWTATATNVDGTHTGDLTLPVSRDILQVNNLLC